MTRTTTSTTVFKPVWPYPDIVRMTAHPNGQWCKKIKGKIRYFGPWADPSKTLKVWRDCTEGRVRPQDLKTIGELVDAFNG